MKTKVKKDPKDPADVALTSYLNRLIRDSRLKQNQIQIVEPENEIITIN
jgi:hypothetical protein